MGKKHRIVQISDLHLLRLRYEVHRGIPPALTFRKILDAVQDLDPAPRAIILSGDISNAGYPDSYYLVDRLLMPMEIPYYWLPGNHDDATIMSQMEQNLSVERSKCFELGGRRIVLLNSVIPDQVYGRLSPHELHFLRESLKEDIPAIIFVHHHPINKVPKLKDYMLLNANEMFGLLEEHPQVEAVFFGHTHVVYDAIHHGVKYYSAPPSVFDHPEINKITRHSLPGFRVIEWEDNAPLETTVHHIDISELLPT